MEQLVLMTKIWKILTLNQQIQETISIVNKKIQLVMELTIRIHLVILSKDNLKNLWFIAILNG